jgi:MFS family permease
MAQAITMEDTPQGLNETNERRPDDIEWKQLWSLVALYASIVIGWIAYYRYQPKLLLEFKFTDFTFLLAVVQGVILVITPPIAGKLGDRFRFKDGHRMPIISTGISFAAMIFMAVAFTLLSNPGEVFKWVLPILIVLWLFAMSIFTSPALSTLELFTPVDKLPKALALLTIVANLLYSLEPVIVDIIDYLGAPLTFITGGVAVFVSGYALKKNSIGLFKKNESSVKKPMASFKLDVTKSNMGYIFFMGIVMGLATTILFNALPNLLEQRVGEVFGISDGNLMIVGILVLSALISLPASNFVNQIGLNRSFWISFLMLGISTCGILFLDIRMVTIFMCLIFAVTFAALSVSSLPLAIKNSNYYEKVFCVGIFFSGVAVPDGIAEAFLAF